MRSCVRRLQFGMGSVGGQHPFADLMKPQSNDKRFDGTFQHTAASLDPMAAAMMQQQLQRALSPEMKDNLQRMMSSMTAGKEGFGTIGVMAFGMGENERGKKVARGAKMEFDPATGKMKTDFHEHQLDPDDPMLPKETVENYDTSNCIEVELDDNPAPGTRKETVLETEIEIEEPNKPR